MEQSYFFLKKKINTLTDYLTIPSFLYGRWHHICFQARTKYAFLQMAAWLVFLKLYDLYEKLRLMSIKNMGFFFGLKKKMTSFIWQFQFPELS